MAEFSFKLTPMPALGGLTRNIGRNRIVERDDLALVSVATPLGGESDLAHALNHGFGLALPSPTQSTSQKETHAISTAPDQFLVTFPTTGSDASQTPLNHLGHTGYVTDQTGAWVILDLSGPDTLAALERLCPLDTANFAIGQSARTVMEHLGAIILRRDKFSYRLMSASSSARSFLHAVETSYSNVVD